MKVVRCYKVTRHKKAPRHWARGASNTHRSTPEALSRLDGQDQGPRPRRWFLFQLGLVALLAVNLVLGDLLRRLFGLVVAVAATFDGTKGIGKDRDQIPRVSGDHLRLGFSDSASFFLSTRATNATNRKPIPNV